jgi:tetrahydromethanopterin S-methyltransferase subunit A
MKVAVPILVFVLITGVHAWWHLAGPSHGQWAAFRPDHAGAGQVSYLSDGEVWLGPSYAAAGAFAAFCLMRIYRNRKRAVAGAAGGLALTGFLYAAGCFLLGCCGSPMLAVYIGLFGPRFARVSGPLVFVITLASVAFGFFWLMRKKPGQCACEGGLEPCEPDEPPEGPTATCCAAPSEEHKSDHEPALRESLERAAGAEKCWSCGCAHQLADAIGSLPAEGRSEEVEAALQSLRSRLRTVEYDCLGCAVCIGAQGLNALGEIAEAGPLPSQEEQGRSGWPPRPGDYYVLRFGAPVAVCTLTDAELARRLAQAHPHEVSMVGTLQTENLGIERIIANVTADPNIRFLVLCGEDSKGKVGHLPGQSFLSLARNGIDAEGRIVGAQGKRPRIRNLRPEHVEHFRRNVEVVDCIGECGAESVLRAVNACASRDLGAAEPFEAQPAVERVQGFILERMVSDPAGYFLVLVDRRRGELCMEHYANSGVLDAIVTGGAAPELYTAAIDRGLLSRLDHAAYLGRELARAERALRAGEDYVQDAAPEASDARG